LKINIFVLFLFMKKYNGILGARFFSTEKRVVLFDDYDSRYHEFDTIAEAVEAREKEAGELNSAKENWADLKMIFQFNPEKSEYEIQTDLPQIVHPKMPRRPAA
jgi:hypothetical protein